MPDRLTGRPYLPSITKLGKERRVTAVENTAPTNNPAVKELGWDVSDWPSVLVTIHPSTPPYNDATMPADATISLRVWRWRSRAGYGLPGEDGQWFSDQDIQFSLAGVPAYGPMEWIIATKKSSRVYLQVVGLELSGLASVEVEVGLYGIGEPRTSTSDGTPYDTGNNPPVTPSPSPSLSSAELMHPVQDTLLSNLTGDFVATYVDSTTVRCVGTFEESALTWMESVNVYLVGRKPTDAADETAFSFHARGSTLDCQVTVADASTFDINLENAFFAATDEILVIIEGPRHRYEVTGIDGYHRQRVRDEAFTVATQSNRAEEIDPLDQRYVPDILADAADVTQGTTVDFYLDMAGYRYFTMQWTPADANFTLTVEATDEDNGTAPAACAYIDVTNSWFGAATFIASTFFVHDIPTFIKYLHIQIVRAGGSGTAAHTCFTRRGW